MEFKQRDLIPSCLPLIFEEAAKMQPGAIVLHGGGMQDQFYDLLRSHGEVGDESLQSHETDYSGIVTWSDPPNRKTIIIHPHHPSAPRYWGSFEKYVDYVAPRLETIRRVLDNNQRRA
jgi:hypothetical protein